MENLVESKGESQSNKVRIPMKTMVAVQFILEIVTAHPGVNVSYITKALRIDGSQVLNALGWMARLGWTIVGNAPSAPINEDTLGKAAFFPTKYPMKASKDVESLIFYRIDSKTLSWHEDLEPCNKCKEAIRDEGCWVLVKMVEGRSPKIIYICVPCMDKILGLK
jgi:hypothetical protein